MLIDIISVDKSDCVAAFNTGIPEDSLLAVCAMKWNADYIITRNIDDFTASPVPAITPEEFLAQWEGK
ncbi:hypothetical protein FACS1894200_12960 [Spirochaetia bacterium]|nr:hypothetical protein FACS1894200_12960 [Spirochaetia bacterium]